MRKIIKHTFFDKMLILGMNMDLVRTKVVFFKTKIEYLKIKCGG